MLRSKIHIKRKGALFAVLFTSIFALIGLTIAFNSDLKIFGNLFKAGAYEAEYREEFTSPTDWTPCTETPKLVTVKNNSPVNVKVRLKYDEFWRNKADTQDLPLIKDGTTLAVINFQNEDDWEQHGEWYYYKEDLAPEAVTSSLFKSVTLDCNANLAVEKVCHETPNGAVCEEPDDDDAYDKYHLAVTVQTSDEDFPREDEHYTVTIDPNGGTYNGSTEVYSESLNYGTVVDLTGVALDNHEIVNWTLNGTETYTGDTITVHDNITLTANWQSIIFHTITVNPNGGTLDGSAETVSTQVRQGETFTLSPNDPIRDGFLFDGWQLSNSTMLTGYSFTVQDDETITATWSPIIAQNNRTSKPYRSITAAEAEASSGDTISLVTDAEEEFTNTKNITLDLNALRLNGSITNNGSLTLLNGEVNSDAGAAVTNNGTLTMGINDYKDDGTVDIQPNYIRLIGTDTGLKQNGQFNFYDGFIEGDIALDGGYNDSPFYRKTFDDEIVHFFPFIDKNQEKDCQHAALESSDLAVSKTTVNGDIYYYSIQDNINTSIRTGYKIYVVREGFSTGESLTVPEDTDITIDIDGHTFTATDTITVNGKLTIEDSKSTINSETGEVEYAGNILTPQTTINNGELVLKNSRMTGVGGNDTIKNNAALTMRGGRLGATNGYVMQPVQGATYDLDEKSWLYSTNTSKGAVYVQIPEFIWNGGNIYGKHSAIYAYTDQDHRSAISIEINGGTISGSSYGINTACASNYCYKETVTVTNATITSNSTGIANQGNSANVTTLNSGSHVIVNSTSGTGVRSNSVVLNGGDITVQGTLGIYGGATINSGSISVTGSNDVRGIDTNGNNVTMNGGRITINGTSGYGIYNGYNGHTLTVTGGEIIAVSTSTDTKCPSSSTRTITGIYWSAKVSASISNVSIDVTGSPHATCDYARGMYLSNSDASRSITVSGDTVVRAHGAGGSSTGISLGGVNASITGGNIYGETFGVYSGSSSDATIGDNDGEISTTSPEITSDQYALYNGSTGYFKYYDGVLRGGTRAYRNGRVTQIADNATINAEQQTIGGIDYDTRYLIPEQYVAKIGETKYYQLSAAVQAVEANETILLLGDNYIFNSIVISSEKEFQINTQGFNMFLGVPITNSGKVYIYSETSCPIIEHYSANYAINNTEGAHLGLNNICVKGSYGISNSGTLEMSNSSIEATDTGINNTGNINTDENTTISGGTYSVYSNGGESTIADATLTGNIYNNSGKLSLANGITEKTGVEAYDLITNNGTLILDSFQARMTNTSRNGKTNDSSWGKIIANTGYLELKNNSIVDYRDTVLDKFGRNMAAIYNDGGETIVSNSTVGITSEDKTSLNSYPAHAISSPTGNVTIESGTITARHRGTAYGIYTQTGNIIIGIAEPTDSPNYGRDTADVSQNNPTITGIDTQITGNYSYVGAGVKNVNSGGKVHYYDGRIAGSTTALPEEPTVTEHFYEVCTELDTSVTPNLYAAHLFWMRDGQSTCGD